MFKAKWLVLALMTLAVLTSLLLSPLNPNKAFAGPVGCDTSAQGIDMVRSIGNAVVGDTVRYSVTLENKVGAPNIACDYTGVTLTVDLPDGTAAHDDGDLITLATGLDVLSGEQYTYSSLPGCVDDAVEPDFVTCVNTLVYVTDTPDLNGSPQRWTASANSTGTVEFPQGDETGIESNQAVNTNLVEPRLTVTKACSTVDGPVVVGDTITYEITVKNTSLGNMSILGITVGDTLTGTLDDPNPFDLTLNQSKTLTFTYTTTVNDIGVNVINTATASSTDALYPGGSSVPNGLVDVSDDGTSAADENCSATENPAISIIKTAGDAADGDVLEIQPGDQVTFHYHVCNEGNVPLHNVDVTDDNGTPADTSDDFTVNIGDLDVGACVDVDSDPITIPTPPVCDQTRLNIGEAAGTSPADTVVTDTDDAELCTPPGGGATRTPGFWQTHTAFTVGVFNSIRFGPACGSGTTSNATLTVVPGTAGPYTVGNFNVAPREGSGCIDLGFTVIDSNAKLFDMFYQSPGQQGTKICAARIQGSFQFLAALLNSASQDLGFGTATLSDADMNAMYQALKGNNRNAILNLAGQFDTFNKSGDPINFAPGTPAFNPATPDISQSLGNQIPDPFCP